MSDGKDQFDRWIDEGVQRYVAAEPPLGMEGRVLARLEPQRRRWWRPWMITMPVAALLALVIGLAVQNNAGTPPKPVVGWSEKGSGPAKPAVATVSNPPAVTARIPHPRELRPTATNTGRDGLRGVSAAAMPKPQQFPSPSPASEQERLLAQLALNQAAAQTVAAKMAQKDEGIVISGITIKPIEIPLLPGPPQGE